MKDRIKIYILWAIGAGVVYFFLSYHIIFCAGWPPELLEKVERNLEYTFYSIKQKKPSTILKIDALREAGIGDILVERGLLNHNQMVRLESKYTNEYE